MSIKYSDRDVEYRNHPMSLRFRRMVRRENGELRILNMKVVSQITEEERKAEKKTED